MICYIDHFVAETTVSNNPRDYRLTQLFHFMRASNFTAGDFQRVTDLVDKRHSEAMDNKIWGNLQTMLYLFTPTGEYGDQRDDISTTNSTICSTDKIIYRVILDLAEIGEQA